MIYRFLQNQVPEHLTHSIVKGAAETETQFVCEALPCDLDYRIWQDKVSGHLVHHIVKGEGEAERPFACEDLPCGLIYAEGAQGCTSVSPRAPAKQHWHDSRRAYQHVGQEWNLLLSRLAWPQAAPGLPVLGQPGEASYSAQSAWSGTCICRVALALRSLVAVRQRTKKESCLSSGKC